MRSPKHVHDGGRHHSGGSHETHRTARSHNRGMAGQSGAGSSDGQRPHKQREFKEVEHMPEGKLTGMRARMSRKLVGSAVEEWCEGKRGSYK